jgi:2-methylisocitrate lyase-like PEP mutase family enzyme
VRRITRVLKVPLSVDAEMGYADTPEAVAENISRLMDVGAVGINLEDGRAEPELLARKIAAVRSAAERAGVALFINARCDVYLKGLVPPPGRVAEALRRGALYREAGASGLFVGHPREPGEIAALCAGAGLPVNVLAVPGVPDGATLAALGVKSISSGSGPAEWLNGQLSRLMQGFLADGSGKRFGAGARSWDDMNALLG